MVAIVSGNTLGLNLTSKGVLGEQGVSGDPTLGQGGDHVYVDAATGNLVVQQLQDELVGAGLDVASVLTYNSQGLANDDNGDNFSLGRAQLLQTGTANAAGSTVVRTDVDGSQSVYAWDSATSRYIARNGAGAFDTIVYAGSYVWTDGATQHKEVYDGTSGRILSRADAAGNQITFGYIGALLTSVTDANGETVTYAYSGNKLMSISAPVTNSSTYAVTTQQVISYDYDTSNRLKSVTVDLSPDGSTADGNVHVTSYTYDGSSTRIQTIQQTDGTTLTIRYDASQRVQTITDALSNVTSFAYDTANHRTSVTANGQTTVYAYDATSGMLTSVTAPAVNGLSPVTQYVYNASGELTSVVDGDGHTTTFGYDAAGNQTSVVDAAGNLTTRTYDAQNRLLSQTTSTLAQPALIASPMMQVGANALTKTGTSVAWDAAARSVNSIAGAATVSFLAGSPANHVMVGLNADPDADNGYASIDYAFYLASGSLQVYADGNYITTVGAYVQGDNLSVAYDGNGHVAFNKNGQSIYSMAASVTQPLYADTSFYEPGASISNLRFSAGSNAGPALLTGGAMIVGPGGNVAKSTGAVAWDSSVYSAAGVTGACTVSFNAGSIDQHAMVGLNSDPGTDNSYGSLDYAVYLQAGALSLWSNGASVAVIGYYAAGDAISLSYDGRGNISLAKNGQSLYSMAANITQPLYLDSSFYEPGSSVSNLRFDAGPVANQALLNGWGMTVGAGGNVSKAPGVVAWDGSVRGVTPLTGPCTVSFNAGSPANHAMVGLNSDPASENGYGSLDYAVYLQAGTLALWSNGSAVVNLGTYAAGDAIALSYDGKGHVSIAKNGQWLYSIAANVTQPLYVDSSFYEPGSAVSNLRVDTTAIAEQTLVNANGITISAGNTLTKSGATAAWDSSAYSASSMSGACTVSFTAGSTATHVMVGLNSDPTTDSSYGSLDYAVYLQAGSLALWSNGSCVANLGVYATGDAFSLSYDGSGHVSLARNGQVLYSMAANITQPLFVDTSFCEPGSSVSNLRFYANTANQPMINGNGMAILAGGNLSKSSSSTAWDASAYGATGMSGACAVSFDAGPIGNHVMVGLNSDPTTDSSYQSIDYALYLMAGNLEVYSNGLYFATIGSYAQGDRFSVSYDGTGHVNFLQNGKTLYSMAATVTQPLFADTCFYEPGSSIANLAFGSEQLADQTIRYVYSADGRGLLRFVISPGGRVTEYDYDVAGAVTGESDYVVSLFDSGLPKATVPTEAQMLAWRASQDLSRTKRTEYARGADEQVLTARTFGTTGSNGVGVVDAATQTTYSVHDKRGDLLRQQTGAPVTSFIVDSLGRAISQTQSLVGTTATAYAGASHTITVNLADGLLRTQTLDNAGRVISSIDTSAGVMQASTTYAYDALGHLLRSTDANGSSVWSLFDADGRKTADIDATGALTELVRDAAGQVTKTISYAIPINTALLVAPNGQPSNPDIATIRPAATTADHVQWRIYDADGRVVQAIDATGAVTQYAYDGAGRLTSTCEFATLVNVALLGNSPSPVTVAPSASDRVTCNYYDDDGHLTGTLAPDRSLTEYRYDGAGQRTVTIKYANASNVPSASTLVQARPASSALDERSLTLYDQQGRIAGQIDPTGTLTGTYYNADGTVSSTTTFVARVSLPLAPLTSIASIAVATPGSDRTTSYTYDADGRIQTQTDPVGTVTTYTYDTGTSNVVSTAVAGALPSAATAQKKYNALGQVIATLDGVGSAAITSGALSATAAWARYGTLYTYDLAGRRASMTDALGNKTLYFYDAAGHLRFTVDPANNVQELRYDAFGNVTVKIAYSASISPAGIGAGGMVTAGLNAAVAAMANAPFNHVSRFAYDADGHQTFAVDPTGAVTQTGYDAFGNVVTRTQYATPIGLPTAGSSDGKTVTVNGDGPGLTGANYAAIDPTHTYTVTARLRQVSGVGAIYVGVSTKDANGNVIGNPYGGTFSYCAAAGVTLTPDMGWVTYTGSISGSYTPATGNYDAHKFLAGSVSASPLILYNYYGSNGDPGRDVEIDSLTLTDTSNGNVLNVDPTLVNGAGSLAMLYGGIDNVQSSATATLSADQIRARLRLNAASDRTTRFAYDQDGRQIYAVDPAGAVTQTAYDALDNVVTRTQYATPIDLPTAGSADGKTVTVYGDGPGLTGANYAAIDPTHTYTVTARMRQVSGSGTVYVGVITKDANGNVISNQGNGGTFAYCGAAGVLLTPDMGWVTYTGSITGTYAATAGSTNNGKTFFAGSVSASPLILYNYGGSNGDPGRDVEIDSLTLTDTSNGNILNVDPTLINGASSLSMLYGPIDNVQSSATATLSADQIRARLRLNAAADRTTRFAYDQDGRQIYAVDPAGAVTQTTYDALDNVVTRTQYATPIDLPTAGSADGKTVTVYGDGPGLTGANYAAIDPTHTYTVTARMRQVSGSGTVYVGVITKDANGNVISNQGNGGTFAYCGAAGVLLTPDMGWVTYTGSITGTYAATAGSTNNGKTFFAGSVSASPLILYNYGGSNGDPGRDLEIDSLTLTDTSNGNVLNVDPTLINGASSLAMLSGAIENVQSSPTTALSADQIRSRLRLNTMSDRTTRFAYDQDGRQIYAVDPGGAVTQTTYDALGNVVTRTQYATPIDLPTAGSSDGKTVTVNGDGPGLTGANYAAIDPTHTYTVTARLRQVSGVGAIYVGVSTKDANGNVIGNPYGGTFSYCAAAGVTLTPDMGWVTYTGSISGSYTPTTGNYDAHKFLAGSVSASPLILYNYYGSNGDPGRDVEIDSLTLTDTSNGNVLNVDPTLVNGAGSLAMLYGGIDDVQSSPTAALSAGQIRARLRLNTTSDRTTRFAYDQDGRQTYVVDPAGAVTQTTYDVAGNVVTHTQYATPIDLPTAGSSDGKTVTVNGDGPGLTGANYAAIDPTHTYTVTARMRQVSGSGTIYVGVSTKDANGNVIGNPYGGTFSYCAAAGVTLTPDMGWVTYTGSISGSYTPSTGNYDAHKFLAGSVSASPLILYNYYGSNGDPGRDVEIDSLTLTDTSNGNVLNVDPTLVNGAGSLAMLYGGIDNVQSSPTAVLTADQIRARLRLSTTSDRTTRLVYDAAGRVTLSVDPAGVSTTYAYDALGNLTQTRKLANAIAASSAIKVNYVAGTNSSASRTIGKFAQGDVVTATVRFKAPAGMGGHVFIGNLNNYVDSQETSLAASGDGWQTLSVTMTVASANEPLWVFVYGSARPGGPVAGDYAIYDNLVVTSAQKGVVLTDEPDAMSPGSAFTLWSVDGVAAQVAVAPADSGTDAQLQAMVAAIADPARDRTTTDEYDADGRVVYSVDAMGHATRVVYDTMGNAIYTIGPDGSLTANQCDNDGRVTKASTFATTVPAATLAGLAHVVSAAQAAALVPASSPSDAVTQNRYDGLGRLRFTMDGMGGLTELRYDTDGNVVDRIGYANQATWNAGADPTVVADLLHDRHVHASYDAWGNVIAQSDGTGAVVVNTYDVDGRLTDRISYANRIPAGSWTAGQMPSVAADAARDIHERFVRDALGQLTYSADGTGAVTAYVYDDYGNLTQKTALATKATNGQALNAVAINAALDRTERFGYDTFGRQVWHADATGALTYTGYDADGRVSKTIQYAQAISGSLPAGTTPLATGAADRVTQLSYNTFGQVTYTLDPLGRVSLDCYFLDGTLKSTTNYAATVGAGAGTSTVVTNAALDETTQYQYDAAGRLQQRTDAARNVQSYTYDGVGNKVSFINEKSLTWSYAYDAAGRLLTETTPVVNVTTLGAFGGNPVQWQSTQNIVTAMVYDRVGNLLSRTEASGTADARTTAYDYDTMGRQTKVTGQAFGIYSESAASFSADTLVGAAARQETSGSTVSTTFYDAFGNAVANVAMATTGQSGPPVSFKVYDQANRLIDEIDAKGYVTAYTRDAFGEGTSVIRYSQPTALNLGVPAGAATAPSAATIAAAVAAPSATNRQIDYVFDAAGRITKTSGPSGTFNDASSATSNSLESNVRHVVVNTYDAFGDLVLVHDLQNAGLGVYADTYNYFDAGGRNVATVDARGFATRRQFDSFDNLTQQTEFAGAKSDSWSTTSYGSDPAAQAGIDRTATYTYDQLNRNTVETHTLAFENAADIAGGSYANSGTKTTTTYGYDAVGNLAVMANESGSTYMEYDALGRLRAKILPAQGDALDANTLSPVTEYWYDELGQQTVQTQHANGATGVTDFRGVWTDIASKPGYAVAVSTDDRTTLTAYDKAGHVIEVDAPGWSTANGDYRTYSSYDAMGRLAKTWHTVAGKTSYSACVYDAVGQVATSYAPSSGTAAQHAVDTEYTYNGFGELVAKGVKGTTYETFDYDNNGNLWRSKTGDGAVKVFMYDLSGRQTAVVVSDGLNSADHNLGFYGAAAWDLAYSDIAGGDAFYRRTDTVLDKMGHVLATIEPQRENATSGFSLLTGSVGLSTTTGTNNSQINLIATWPNLSALGAGDIRVITTASAGTSTNNFAYTSTTYFSSVTAATGASLTVKTGLGPPYGTPSIQIARKDVNGQWQTIVSSASNGTAINVVGIAAPTGATNVQMTYKSAAMSSPVTATATNFGSLWGLNMGTTAGVVTYTLSFTNPDGTTTPTSAANFTIGAATAGAPSTSYVRPVTLQVVDRWGNVLSRSDPRSANWLTTYGYNSNNQVVRQVQGVNAAGASLWSGFDNNGARITAAPTTNIYYDAQGHQVEMVDANSHKTLQKYDAAGNVIETDLGAGTADQSKSVAVFDLFSNQVESISGRGFAANGSLVSNASDFTTLYGYDKANHLLRTQHGTTSGGNVYAWGTTGTGASFNATIAVKSDLVESSTYDADGHKLTSTDASNYTTTYTYDLNGNLLTTVLPLLAGQSTGAKTSEDYDDFGHKTRQTDADGNTETWNYDYFGKRLVGTSGHTDLMGNVYTYTYDNAGDLLTQTSKSAVGGALQNESYTYDKGGQLTRLSQAVDATRSRVTQYTYDLSGQHLRETTSQGTTSAMVVYQDNHLSYDVLGRLMDSSDESVHVSFGYDAVGNKIHTASSVILDQALTTANANTAASKGPDYWNAFDALNRQIGVNYAATYDGSHNVTALHADGNSHTLTYDADSNRASDSHVGNTVVVDHKVIIGGEDAGDQFKVGQAGVTVTDNYAYDALDRLDYTWRATSSNAQQVIDQRSYDADGRTVMEGPGLVLAGDDYQGSYFTALNQGITDTSLQIGSLYTLNAYDTHGQVIYSESRASNNYAAYSITDYSQQTTAGALTRGYDAMGNLMGQSTTNYNSSNSATSTQSTVNTLVRLENYQVFTTTAKVGSSAPDTATTLYDLDGTISSFSDPAQTTFNRNYVADSSGQVLSTIEGTQVLRNLVVDGHVMGQYGAGLDVITPQSANGTANIIDRANFGFGFKQVSGAAAGNGNYVVNAGDTLQSIAYSSYGDSGQWWRIAQANGLASDHDLRVGQTLRMPSVTGGTHSDTSTFEPYDPSKIEGDMSAHLPTPAAAGGGCGAVGMIVMIVVAVVATVFTAGAALAAMAPELMGAMTMMEAGAAVLEGSMGLVGVAAAAVGGAVGSIVSQGVGMAIGAQKDFSWKAVATSAVGSAVTTGVGELGIFSEGPVGAMEAAAVSNTLTQGIDSAANLQKGFSWKQLAASTAAAGAGAETRGWADDGVSATSEAVTGSATAVDPMLRKAIDGTVGGYAGGVTATLARGGKLNSAQIAADAFGNAVGQSLAQSSNGAPVGGYSPYGITNESPAPEPIQIDVNGLLPGSVNVASDNNADPMPNGSIDSIMRRDGKNDGSPYTWGKVVGNVSRAEGGNTTQMGEFGVLNNVSNLDKVSGTAWYKMPLAGTYDTAAADAAYQGQALSWKDASDNQTLRETNREQFLSDANWLQSLSSSPGSSIAAPGSFMAGTGFGTIGQLSEALNAQSEYEASHTFIVPGATHFAQDAPDYGLGLIVHSANAAFFAVAAYASSETVVGPVAFGVPAAHSLDLAHTDAAALFGYDSPPLVSSAVSQVFGPSTASKVDLGLNIWTAIAGIEAPGAIVSSYQGVFGSVGAGGLPERIVPGAFDVPEQLTIPGMDRPLRIPNAAFPPNAAAVEAMNGELIQRMASNGSDCSEIAQRLLDASGGNGYILRVNPQVKFGGVNVYENGATQTGQYYHEVYTDGGYVFDPRVSPQPIPTGDWLQHMNGINPAGVNIGPK